MGAIRRKYGTATVTATHASCPMVKRDSADFASGDDWTPAAGDVKVIIDGVLNGNIGTLPTCVNYVWYFPLTAAELTGKRIEIVICDAVTKAVEDNCILIETEGNALAMHPTDIDGLTFISAMEAILAALFGVAEPSGNTVIFKKRDGETAKLTITYGSEDGERTASTINS